MTAPVGFVEAGDVLSAHDSLIVEREYPGQSRRLNSTVKKGERVYEIGLLRKGGALVKLKIHARDGTTLGFKERRQAGRQGEPSLMRILVVEDDLTLAAQLVEGIQSVGYVGCRGP